MKRGETGKGWADGVASWTGCWSVHVCDARLMYEERLKPEATGTEAFPPVAGGRMTLEWTRRSGKVGGCDVDGVQRTVIKADAARGCWPVERRY